MREDEGEGDEGGGEGWPTLGERRVSLRQPPSAHSNSVNAAGRKQTGMFEKEKARSQEKKKEGSDERAQDLLIARMATRGV